MPVFFVNSSKAVHFHPAHMILQSVHRVIEIVWYIYPYLDCSSLTDWNWLNLSSEKLVDFGLHDMTNSEGMQFSSDSCFGALNIHYGSFHQGDERFSSRTRGSQCVGNALSSLILAHFKL